MDGLIRNWLAIFCSKEIFKYPIFHETAPEEQVQVDMATKYNLVPL